jgi:hypothetical protein
MDQDHDEVLDDDVEPGAEPEPEDDDERPDEVRSVLLKALAVVASIGVLIALGTTVMVQALGLDESESSGPVGAAGSATSPNAPLPTTALPVPGKSGTEPAQQPTDLISPSTAASGPIQLSVSPVLARPMERVNLTGTYPGHDNVGLAVQRWEAGGWADFGVSATVRAGTFETYVMTGRAGENRFRMYDPEADNGSNPVVVTVD